MTARPPYPGLRPFQQDEADLFFGREVQVEEMLTRLEDRRFLAVVGTSGCGKSSLVRAGLLPALEQGFLSGANTNWRMAVMNPGNAPFRNLAAALVQESALDLEREGGHQAVARLQATLRRGPQGLIEAVAESHLPDDTNLFVVVDQFEEIFRYRKQGEDAQATQHIIDADAFVNLLLASVQVRQPRVPIYVVMTMRSDFIGDCALFTGLPEAINDSQFLTPRLTRDQYRTAIAEPALVVGGQLRDDLVNELLNDLGGEPDQLPVLQHALMQMWTQAAQGDAEVVLTLGGYQAVGGLAGALSKHCDEILNQALDSDQRRIAEVMFRALCERSSEQRDTRRPVPLGDIAAIAGVDVEAVLPVVEAFRATGRHFLTPPSPTPLDAGTTLDISHESLIRQWQTLNDWVADEADAAQQYWRLEDDAKRHQQGEAELWRGANLHMARAWRDHVQPTADWAKRYGDAYRLAMDFLRQSEAEEKQQQAEEARVHERELEQARELAEARQAQVEEQTRAARRSRIVAGVVGVLLVVMIGVAIYANIQQRRAAEAETRAKAEEQKARVAAQIAEYAAKEAKTSREAAIAAAEEADVQRKVAIAAAKETDKQRKAAIVAAKEADRQREIAYTRLARYFAAVSKANIKTNPTLGILLSVEAVRTSLIPSSHEAITEVLNQINGVALLGHEGVVTGVDFSPDGRLLASASTDKTVRLWQVNVLDQDPTLLSHDAVINGVSFSPNGELLATVSGRHVRLWQVNALDEKPTMFKGHESLVRGVLFHPHGDLLATAGEDGTVRLWRVHAPDQEPALFQGDDSWWNALAFSPDGQLMAIASESTVHLWQINDPDQKPIILQGPGAGALSVSFSPDSARLATAADDGTIRLWQVNAPDQEPTIFQGDTIAVRALSFSPSGQQLAAASQDHTVRLWQLNAPDQEPFIFKAHDTGVLGVSFSPSGKWLATAGTDHIVRLWRVGASPQEPASLYGHKGGAYGVAYSPNGEWLATADFEGIVRLWQVNALDQEPTLLRGHEDSVYGVAFSPNGERLATASDDKTVRLWQVNAPDQEPLILSGHERGVFGVAFSPNGELLATTGLDSTIRLWQVNAPNRGPLIFRGHEAEVFEVAFSPDGELLATASEDKTIRLWQVNAPNREPVTLDGHDNEAFGVAFSPDGKLLATTSLDKTVRLWQVNDFDQDSAILQGHEDGVAGVAFSPDGELLATASGDQTVRLWRVHELDQDPIILKAYENTVLGVAFSPNSKRLATAGNDQVVHLWTLGTDDLIRRACLLSVRNFSIREWSFFLARIIHKNSSFLA